MGVREQGFLAELLCDPEEASTEVGCRRGVLGEKGSEAQQARRLSQTLKVFRILREPRAEHRTHRSGGMKKWFLRDLGNAILKCLGQHQKHDRLSFLSLDLQTVQSSENKKVPSNTASINQIISKGKKHFKINPRVSLKKNNLFLF